MLSVWAMRQGLLLSTCENPTLYLSFWAILGSPPASAAPPAAGAAVAPPAGAWAPPCPHAASSIRMISRAMKCLFLTRYLLVSWGWYDDDGIPRARMESSGNC